MQIFAYSAYAIVEMPKYAEKHAMCGFLQNMRYILRSHDRYKPVSVPDWRQHAATMLAR